MIDLFRRLVSHSAPAIAVMALLQLMCGERADCVRQCRMKWFKNLTETSDHVALAVPQCNGKTSQREIPLLPAFGRLLHKWIHDEPLKDH